jgi:uncharacterized protein involved in type VI secretion and phage assembly
MNQYFGKYRGKVTDNRDDQQMGRLKANVPDVLGIHESNWAMPCVAFAGGQSGFSSVPAIGSGVWIEFECGDSRYPVWTGCYWGENQLPALALPDGAGGDTPQKIVIQSVGQNYLIISDEKGAAGGIVLQSGGATISINDQGITITNGQGASLQLTGPTVKINGNALEVT